MRESLTQPQRETLEYIKQYIAENNISPTIRELANKFGVYVSPMQCRLRQLRDKGYITWRDGKPRTIRLIEEPSFDRVVQLAKQCPDFDIRRFVKVMAEDAIAQANQSLEDAA